MLLLIACAGSPPPEPTAQALEPQPPTAERIVFEEATEKHSPAVWVDGTRHPLTYKVFAEDGQEIGGTPFGQLVDINGDPIGQCNNQDFSALIQVEGTIFHLSHVECHPGAVYLTQMDENLDPVWTRPVDFSEVRGTMINCSGDVTPWNTLLSSEEYEPDASKYVPGEGVSDNWQGFNRIASYFPDGLATVNPYDYGWIPEVWVLDAEGTTKVVKHYSMGRFSHELAVVTPDRKTVFLSDDGYGVGFFRFVADTADDLSSGTLYIARIEGESVKWLDLGHASNGDIDVSLRFEDLFERDAEGCTTVLTQFGEECLTVKEGMEIQASRLESRRYGAMLGGTTEFTKAEGLAVDAQRNTVWLAVTTIDKGMTRGHPEWDVETADHLKLVPNGCGAILGFHADGGDWNPDRWSVGLSGRGEGTVCDPEGIAGPDNITMLGDLVMIAEDTRLHDPNVLWAWDPDDDSLTRVVKADGDGAEVAGIHHYPDVGWFTVTEQHGPRGARPSKSAVLGPIPDL